MSAKQWFGPAGLFAALVATLVAGNAVTHNAGGSPGRLPISLRGAGTAAAPTSADAEGKRAAPGYYGGNYRLAVSTDGLPTRGPAYRLGSGAADADAVRRLARALGITAEPQRQDRHWQVGTDGTVLYVSDDSGQRWDFQPFVERCKAQPGTDCAVAIDVEEAPSSGTDDAVVRDGDEPVSSDGSSGSSGSGVAPAPGILCPEPVPGAELLDPVCKPVAPPSPPPGPSKATALSVARRVLTDAGVSLDGATFRADPGWGTQIVSVRLLVGGLPVLLDTTVEVNADGAVARAGGWLGAATREDDYPLLTPQQAIDRGASGPQPAIGIPKCEAATPECTEEPADRDVTAIRLGLMPLPSYEEPYEMYLAPAWLLTVDGSEWEEPLLALPDEYLSEPPVPSVEPMPLKSGVSEPGECPPDADCAVSGEGGEPGDATATFGPGCNGRTDETQSTPDCPPGAPLPASPAVDEPHD